MKNGVKRWLGGWRKWLPLWCYAAALALWLALALADCIGDGLRAEAVLDPGAAAPVNMDDLGGGAYVTQNTDPQLIFENLNADVRVVRLCIEIDQPPGEMELFYTRQGAGFSVRQRVIGVPQDDGSYLYFLPAGRVAGLRLDPGFQSGAALAIRAVVLNPRLPMAHYLWPGLRGLAALAVLPALASAVIYTIIEGASGVRAAPAERPKRP